MKDPILGVIGGLGPMATARFMEQVINMTDAAADQENVNMIVYNFPSIPDRTGYILGSSQESPLPGMIRIGQALAEQGVSCIAIPCVTAHYFHADLQEAIPVPVINGVGETVRLLRQEGIDRVGIMATDGTVRTQLLSGECLRGGITPILPSPQGQAEVMHLIYENVKAGIPAEMDRFRKVQQELLEGGAQVIILGCTELSVIKENTDIGPGFLDIMDVLARESVLRCGKKLRQGYECLITGGKR